MVIEIEDCRVGIDCHQAATVKFMETADRVIFDWIESARESSALSVICQVFFPVADNLV